MPVLLSQLRDLALDAKAAVAFIRGLAPNDLRWIYEHIGLDKPPGEKKRSFPVAVKKKRRFLASMIPIEVHAEIMARLWPKIYGSRKLPRRYMVVTTAKEAVEVMMARAAANREIFWPGRDDVEITDRKRLFHRQGHQFEQKDSTRRKNGRTKYLPTLSKMMTSQAAYHGDEIPLPGPSGIHGKICAGEEIGFNGWKTGNLHFPHVVESNLNRAGRGVKDKNYLRVPKLANLDAAERKTVVRGVCDMLKKMRAGRNGSAKHE